MFEQEAEERTKQYMNKHTENYNCENTKLETDNYNVGRECGYEEGFQDGAEFGFNKANEWHYVNDGGLPRQAGHTCFSIEVLASNKKWVYYEFGSGKWFCGNKEVKVTAWKEIVFPKE